MTVAEFLERVGGGRKSAGDKWAARCPAHDDRTPSLSVWEGRDGRVMFNCHANCSKPEVLAALGLTWADVGPSNGRRLPPAPSREPEVQWFDSHHLDGTLAYRVRREDRPWLPKSDPAHKDVRPYSPNGTVGLNGAERILYRWPETVEDIAAGKRILIVEGEPKVEALRARGLSATTSGGATSWRDAYAPTFAGADVVVLPDNDEPGRKYGRTIVASLTGIAKSVRAVELPGVPEHGDVIDWFDSGRTVDELLAVVDAPVDAPEPTRWRLSDLYARPDLLEPPKPIVPRIAWPHRTTLFASREKFGKSTLLAYVAAEVSKGGCVFELPCETADVLLIGLEEFIGDIARRYQRFHATPNRVHVVVALATEPTDRIHDVRRHIQETGAKLVIVDTLMAYTSGGVTDANNAAQMQPFVQALTQLARETGAAIVIVGHGKKSDGSYRDSSAIGAAVDVIIEMTDEKGDDTLRHVRVRGRVPTADFDYRFERGEFILVSSTDRGAASQIIAKLGAIFSGNALLAQEIVDIVAGHPGASNKAIRDESPARAAETDKVIAQLLKSGEIVDAGTEHRHKYYVKGAPELAQTDLSILGRPGRPAPGTIGRPGRPDGTTSGRGADDPSDESSEALERSSPYVIGDDQTPTHVEAA
jgi:hypothetical protein